MGGLVLLDPLFLGALALVVLGLVLRLRGGAPAARFAPAALGGKPLPSSLRSRLLALPRVLEALALCALVFALARPVAREPLPQRREGLDILLCLDTSSSMRTNDLDRTRTRLAVAKDAAAAFIERRPEDRIGLITFARYPDLACPMTVDHDALASLLADVETVPSDGPEDATGIGGAVARAAATLPDGGVVVLLTDGEENVALEGVPGEIPPVQAAQLAERLGVRVYAIVAGIGRRAPDGAWVKLDTRAVESLAKRTGGTFHRVRDAGALTRVYEAIDALETSPFEEPHTVIRDRYLPFLLTALMLWLLGQFLAATWLDVLP